MAKVTCKISYPADFGQEVVLISADIDDEDVVKSIPEQGVIQFENDDIFVADGIVVFALVKAPTALELSMDIFQDNDKINKKPVKPVAKDGKHIFSHSI
ncbi:MAG: hypothetical protein ABJF11_15330 [Reichenbachiella sp.]|uniref:hypothetical protein n=1 Tax=Reichenbachiella sp. TaxID=2184521 RepID=UPI0032660ED4